MNVLIKRMPHLKQNQISLSDSFLSQVANPRRTILKVGAWKKEVEVIFDSDLSNDTICLSTKLELPFILPDSISFEMKIHDGEINLGPVIAFVAFKSMNGMKKKLLPKYEAYFQNYQEIKGLIFICAANSFSTKTKTVKGYYYSPAPLTKSPWHYGVFPYPGAIYRRKTIPRRISRHISRTIGDRMFNTELFNKWDLWQTLSPYPELREHLPHTIKVETSGDLEKVLDTFDKVYLKRVNGLRGEGLLRGRKIKEGYRFMNRFNKIVHVKSKEGLSDFIHNTLSGQQYIAQQAVPLTYNERKVDFRVIMQKDYSKQWNCSAIIARLGRKGGIATNFTSSGYVLPGEKALCEIFNLTEEEASLKVQNISDICKKACEMIDKSLGHYGDVGIDVIIDPQQKVWILEINKFHMHSLPLHLKNDSRDLFYKVVTTPFYYAKALADF